jgi:CheY-like chemotaxis protein
MRAMVVDDMKSNQEIHKRFLERCGMEVADVAANGKEAYDIYKIEVKGISILFSWTWICQL